MKLARTILILVAVIVAQGCQSDVEKLTELCAEMHDTAQSHANDCVALKAAVATPMKESQQLQAQIEKSFQKKKTEITNEDRERYKTFMDAMRPCQQVQLMLAGCGDYE